MSFTPGQHRPLYLQEQIVCLSYLKAAHALMRETREGKVRNRKARAADMERQIGEYLRALDRAFKSKSGIAGIGPIAIAKAAP